MTLTNQVDYALREMMFLARSNSRGWTATNLIAKEMDIPKAFLSRINMLLVKADLLESQRGAKGGVRLAKEPGLISVYEIVSAIDGPVAVNKCLANPQECTFPMAAQYKAYWQQIQHCLDERLIETNLKELIEFH
ncbi:MAG: Rrf2 family transcriptional regulator [Anaerolineaceae bacterium]|nr:Rrf2 family transcriptional regulator [Anaerolineaceae bacterium]MDD4043322.1 Rrf2 family transcriptional regulator [Anaerolineaceae bacterium]MDD4577762.1 Rrf2 family transcriptional regulator [Anaerolineaceae bacterium]